MAIYLLDGDMKGTNSVRHLVEAKKVFHIPIPSYTAFTAAITMLMSKAGPGDLVIGDTVSKIAETFREDWLHGEETDELKAISEEMKNEKYGQNSYRIAQRKFMRRFKNLRALGCRVITTFHEKDQADLSEFAVRKRGPQINPAWYDSICGSSSDIFRMYIAHKDVLDKNTGAIKFPRGTRFLQLQDDEDALAKFSVTPDLSAKIPRLLPNPTLPKLWKILGNKSEWLTIYGPPGCGKTTLACSECE